jgi:hypothetical protein
MSAKERNKVKERELAFAEKLQSLIFISLAFKSNVARL